jgi:hypothetical protein
MNIRELAAKGITRFRRPMWVNKNAYVRIDLFPDGLIGPWYHIYDRPFQELTGMSIPTDVLSLKEGVVGDYVEYTGELDKTDTTGVVDFSKQEGAFNVGSQPQKE